MWLRLRWCSVRGRLLKKMPISGTCAVLVKDILLLYFKVRVLRCKGVLGGAIDSVQSSVKLRNVWEKETNLLIVMHLGVKYLQCIAFG